MNHLTATQMSSLCSPPVMLQIFTQLQMLQSESSTIWKHCNVTIVDLTKQADKCQRERKRWRQMEQELLDEKDTLQHKFLNALEKNTELEGLLQQQKQHKDFILTETNTLRDSLQKVQKELQNALEELNKYKEIAKNKEEELRKVSKHMQEMVQELSIGKEQSELCNILADTIIDSEGKDNPPKTVEANSTVRKLWRATDVVKNLISFKSEMQNVSSNLEAVVQERDQLKKDLQRKDIALLLATEEKSTMYKEIRSNEKNISSLSKEKQQLQHQLEEEAAKSSSLQQELAEQKRLCASHKEAQGILKGRTPNVALLDAATRGNVTELEILLNVGANIEATDDKGRTPLILATMKKHIEACKFLVNKGANLEASATELFSNTPFLAAVIHSENLDAVKFLADAGANMYANDSLGTTAFQKDAINKSIRQ